MRKLILASMLLCAGSAIAQTSGGYVTDSSGNIVRSGFGLCVHTGSWTPAHAVAGCDANAPVAAATPVAVPPVMPAPMLVSAPEQVRAPVSIVVPANVLFAFDKAILRPEGQKALRDILAQHPASTIESVVITGHTDRLGSNKYNQSLSERRANEVAGFLISSGVNRAVVKAEGRGETEPVTKATDCTSKKIGALRACYAPDRRVEVKIQSVHAQ